MSDRSTMLAAISDRSNMPAAITIACLDTGCLQVLARNHRLLSCHVAWHLSRHIFRRRTSSIPFPLLSLLFATLHGSPTSRCKVGIVDPANDVVRRPPGQAGHALATTTLFPLQPSPLP